MPDFVLITSEKQFYAEAEGRWADYSPNLPMQKVLNVPHEMPHLASIFVSNGIMSAVVVDRKSAKRLIYPKTNRRRAGMRWFDWIDGNLDEEIETYINVTLDKHKLNREGPLQTAYIDELVRKVKGKKGPVLVTNCLYNIGDKTAVNFFLVTKELASSLVYYNKNKSRHKMNQMRQEIKNSLFTLNVGINGKIAINTSALFYIQRDIPRFTNETETGIQAWETSAIKDMNTALNDTQLGIKDTRAFVKRITSDFLDERKHLRAAYAANHMGNWINKIGLDPEVDELIQQAIAV